MADYEFSFVLPSFNEGRYLAETVESIRSTAKDAKVEIIAVDDHSDDFSGEDLASAHEGDNSVKVVKGDKRMGVAGARNYGAERALGKTLIFMDAHSRMPDAWPSAMRSAIEVCDVKTLYGTPLFPLGEVAEGTVSAHGVWLPHPDLDEKYCTPRINTDRPYPVMALPGGSIVVNRAFFQELGGFDPGLMPPWGQESIELCMRVWALGYEVRIIPTIEIHTLYKEQEYANPGIKVVNLLYNRLRIAALYFDRDRFERVCNELRHHDWFGEAVAMMMFEGMAALVARSISAKRDPEEIFERFGLYW